MDIKEAIYSRRAVREYTAESVAEQTIRDLIDAAVQAPSARNEQPWSFTVVRDPELLDRISTETRYHILRTTPSGLLWHDVEENPEFQIFYHAPVLIVISSVSDGHWAVINCALAAENLMLAARAAGLGSCWIGYAQSWLATSEGKAALKLPPGYFPVAPIIVGHPRVLPAPVPRKQPEIRWIGE